jgi:hypothetical protein
MPNNGPPRPPSLPTLTEESDQHVVEIFASPDYSAVVGEGMSGSLPTTNATNNMAAPPKPPRPLASSPSLRFANVVQQVIDQNAMAILPPVDDNTLHSQYSPPSSPKPLRRKNPWATIKESVSEPGLPRHGRLRRNTHARIKFLQDNLGNLKHVQPKKVIKNLRPTKIPLVKRFVDWARLKWPGKTKWKYIFESPYFFLYIISMSLIQALLSAVTASDFELVAGWSLTLVVSVTFFGLYIIEVILRMVVKGFDFFTSLYNLAEVGLTLSAFILDFQISGTSFVANVLSLRIMWVIQ